MAHFISAVCLVLMAVAVNYAVSGNKPSERNSNVVKNYLAKLHRTIKNVERREQKIEASRAAEIESPMTGVPDCHVNLTLSGSAEGTLHSPFYPSNYKNTLRCEYHIWTPPGYLLQLNFIDFQLEAPNPQGDEFCPYDYVRVLATTDAVAVPLSARHCGTDAPIIAAIDYNNVLIEFVSDFSKTERGFSLVYKAFIPGELCVFGQKPDCAFQCHCANDTGCDGRTGECVCKNLPKQDDFVGDQWTGPGCQTGNLALHKPANQSGTGIHIVPGSNTLHPMVATQATDGYTDIEDWVSHCAWVVNEDPSTRAWWIVDLGGLYQVETVIIYNTEDLEKAKTLGYISLKHSQDSTDIRIMQGCSGVMTELAPSEMRSMKCPMVARYIGIERMIHPDATDTHTMLLCEVQVIGHVYYDVDCAANGSCAGECYPGLYCDQCRQGYRQPECTSLSTEVLDCGVPDAIANGNVSYRDSWTASAANYTCDVGFKLEGQGYSVCGIDGAWTSPPTCAKLSCGMPPVDSSAETLDYSGTQYGDMVVYQCAAGYKLVGKAILYCTADGTWDEPAPKCELISCGAPPVIQNAVVTAVTGNVVSSVVAYMCESGFLSNGYAELVCDANGTWSNENERPECTGVPCGAAPKPPLQGEISYTNGTTYTSVVEYTCEDDYFMLGLSSHSYTISCTAGGKWSGFPKICIQECGGLLTNSTGVITSPKWPEPYESNRNCTWLIKAPRPGDQIHLHFTDFDVEDEKNCSYDHIDLYDSNGRRTVPVSTHCGTNIPADITTVGNYMLVVFTSDAAEETLGFRAEYTVTTAESMEDTTAALEVFYPELMVETMVESNMEVVSEAVTYLKSYLLTIDGAFEHAECLFILEAEDGIENILYFHSVPRLKHYLYNTFDRMIYHIPEDPHTAQVIMDLIEHDNLSQVYDRLVEPLMALQINIQHILGLKEFRPEPVLFSVVEGPLLDTMLEHKDEPAAKVVLFMVDVLHELVMGNTELTESFHLDMLNCPAVESAAVSIVQALENGTQSLSEIMASLPQIIDHAFGPNAQSIVEVYKHELFEQIHILQHPFHVMIAARDEVLSTFTSKQDIGEPYTNSSSSGKISHVEKYLQSTEPITADWLQYVFGENLKIGMLSFIQRDLEHYLVTTLSHVAEEPLTDVTLASFELVAQAFYERVEKDMPGYCLDGKLTAMLTGFEEINLVDIAVMDLNISVAANQIADLLLDKTNKTNAEELLATVEAKMKTRLFNMFRGRLLQLDNRLEKVTGGPVASETLPMDVVLMMMSKDHATMGELITDVIDVVVPTLMVNVTCREMNWTRVDAIVADFIQSFDDLSADVSETYQKLPLVKMVDSVTADRVKALITDTLTGAKDFLLHNVQELHLVKDGEEDRSALVQFFIENLALSLYNVVQMVAPEEPVPGVTVEGLMRVIEWQHSSIQGVLLSYMEGLRKLLHQVKTEEFDPCEKYPHVCKLSLVDSLTTKRLNCDGC